MKVNRFTMICTGDMVIVDFGTSTMRCRTMGKHPAYVVSVDDSHASGARLMVIPAFRKRSCEDGTYDILLKKSDCSGLRYEMYVNVSNIQKVDRMDVLEKIGHVKDGRVAMDVKMQIRRRVGDYDE